ncbi:metal ABC transporter substrate-binding protein [Ornithinimicrobium tianjinense]|uniref:Zinc ABC transporter substrate-binding protein n=1 Tax=Ornithinimicrobium tianjinense TaxID=1195761 RepID=A0A917BMG1_9MICO|nr:zinc ABC transporter substrate-binding protein [Ornithinimicrobium tianjinense]GGF49346.1 zinc ABC transporter substrate-binding protein [Ornithinimicrobium tianjinense]
MPFRSRLAALTALTIVPLTACSGPAQTGTDAGDDGGQVQLVASFYPVEYILGRLAGDRAEITTLTAAGVDPHDVELSPRTVGTIGSADLVVYASGMQPAVDDAVAQSGSGTTFDVVPAADLLALRETAEQHAEHSDDDQHGDDDQHSEDEHADEEESHDDHGHGAEDPHFWLDPVRYADVADAVAEELATVDPDGAQVYRANAAALREDLEKLDGELEAGLADCTSREVVTTHDAFGYLGHRYDLHLTGISGISPESEPSPARLAEVAAMVEADGLTTVYTEPLLGDAIARTLEVETGVAVLTLDPVEGITDASAGQDYLAVMRANLAALRQGQGCS